MDRPRQEDDEEVEPSPEGADKDPESIALGVRLRKLRKEAGLTQEQLAPVAQVHWTYLGQVERGFRNPTYLTTLRLARALDVPLARLYEDDDEE